MLQQQGRTLMKANPAAQRHSGNPGNPRTSLATDGIRRADRWSCEEATEGLPEARGGVPGVEQGPPCEWRLKRAAPGAQIL